jgi:TonB-dependent receptor
MQSFFSRLARSASAGLVLLAALSSVATAQGAITGVIVDDATNLGITGAAVRIQTISREAYSDRTGRFLIANLPAGTYSVVTRFIGYTAVTQEVTVENGRTAVLNLRLTPALTQLGQVVVTATRTGQAAALNQQKNAGNVSNIVAADQIGRFPDANLGDALKRIPGVTVALDQGEARFGSIRGTEPRFNSVMVNGERVPSAEAEVREVQLDLIPADMIQAVEVSKTLTPEMDADAIGGSVNVVTRAAPPGFRLSSTVGGNYNQIREQGGFIGGLVAGNRFFNDKLGIIASASYYDQQFGSDNKEGTWQRTDAGVEYMNQFDLRRYDVQRTRRSMSGSFDWKFNENNSVMLRSLYNHRDDWENRYRARYILGAPNADGNQNVEIRRQTKGGGPDPRLQQTRLEDQRTQSHQLSGEHLLGGRATLTWSGSIARASETRPDERYIDFRVRNVLHRPDYTDQQNPNFTAINEAQVAPERFAFRRAELTNGFTADKDRNARVDLLLPLREGENETRLKFGARIRAKEKVRENDYFFATPTTAFGNMLAEGAQDFTTSTNRTGDYQYGFFATPAFLAGLDFRNPALFNLVDQPGEYAAGNFDASERITAGYIQLDQRFGPRLSMIGGVRVEQTRVEYRGVEYDVDEDEARPTATATQSYADVLPSLNVRYDLDRNTVLRGAVTTSLARPNYFDLVPYREISIEDEELSIGNPDLKTTRALNLDVMAERYFESVGLLSVGVFHKDISDFIFGFTQFNAVDPVTQRTFNTISQPRNGAGATLTGIEFAVQRQLDMLPGLLRYVGLYANYTFNDSKVTGLDIEGRENESLQLLGTAKHSGNFSISYDAPRFSARVAFNYQSEALDAGEGGYNENAFFDRWADRRTDIDANLSWLVTPSARFFVEANNLNDRPLRFFQGDRGRLMQDELYGRRVQSGFKFDF